MKMLIKLIFVVLVLGLAAAFFVKDEQGKPYIEKFTGSHEEVKADTAPASDVKAKMEEVQKDVEQKAEGAVGDIKDAAHNVEQKAEGVAHDVQKAAGEMPKAEEKAKELAPDVNSHPAAPEAPVAPAEPAAPEAPKAN